MAGYGYGCGKAIDQVVPTKYSAKIVPAKCGQTGIYGDPIFCEKCEKKNEGINWRQMAADYGERYDEDY
jgi:hypothetical protein